MAHNDQETAEDFQIAMDLLNKYQKDNRFFKRDAEKLKKQSELVI